jgi:phosphoribosyl-AMP cyclohydrolase
MSDGPDLETTTTFSLQFGKIQDAAKLTPQGLVPVVLQDARSGDVLFIGYSDKGALSLTLSTGVIHLWSTSRNEIWRKGASSGDELALVSAQVNCEQNSLLYQVEVLAGAACHSARADGSRRLSCYYRKVDDQFRLTFIDQA